MKGNKSSTGGMLFRAIGFLLVGVLLNVMFLNTFDTNAWFTSNMETSMVVTAASTEDIIKGFVLDEDVNPKHIELEGASLLLDRSAMIYFEVEGAIDEYILHINPVSIEANKSYSISIEPNVNLIQVVKLLLNPLEVVTGSIRIKYLNEFIDESIQVSFTQKYLIDRFMKEITRKDVKVIGIPDIDFVEDTTTIITYLAKHIIWEDEYYSYNTSNSTPIQRTSMMSSTIELVGNIEDSEVTIEEIPIERLELNEEQSKIINIISPSLQDYLDEIFSIVENLVQKINDKIMIIFGLEHDIMVLQEIEIDLNSQLNEKEKEIEDLNIKNNDLGEQNNKLEQEADELSKEIDRLRQKLNSHECPTLPQQDPPSTTNSLSPIEKPVQPVVIEEQVKEEPVVEEPVAEEPVIEEPVEEEPVLEDDELAEPVIEEPVFEDLVVSEVELDESQ